jgi:hypothetical protein
MTAIGFHVRDGRVRLCSLDEPALAVFVCRLYSALAEMKPGGCRMAKKRKAKKTKRKPKAKRRKRSTRILGVPIPSIS